MNLLLIKIMAVGLTLSQLFTKPAEHVKLNFNPESDQPVVAQHLKDGCAFMIQHFQAENLNVEVMLNMIIENTKAARGETPDAEEAAHVPDGPDVIPTPASEPPKEEDTSFSARMTRQLDFAGLLTAYKLFCKSEDVPSTGVDLAQVIRFYNDAMKDLPDVNTMKTFRLPETATVLDFKGERFSEIYSEQNRRIVVPIEKVPDYVKRAFVAAEDKNFYSHKGLDVVGIIRAFATNLSGQGRPQGGSTITQQVIKNLLLNDDLTFERKMREMVLATQLERILSKDQILELYLNMVFMGRSSWGVEMAAKSYFGKSVTQLTPAEAALIAGLTKGPNYYNPDTKPERANDRRQYVLARMKEDGVINEAQFNEANQMPLGLIPFESPHTRGSYYFLDAIQREARDRGLLGRPYTVRSTIHTELQMATERALQNGLADYESMAGRARFKRAEGSIADEVTKEKISWSEALSRVKARLYDVHWPLAVVLDVKKNPRVGLTDGRTMPLQTGNNKVLSKLKLYDLVFVDVDEDRRNPRAILKAPPEVQGAAIVIENKTGRVLAITGGFSYAASQLNRALRSTRQPGSTLKPFIHLAALNMGYQPNTLIPDVPTTLPPIDRGGKYWSPKNYDGSSRGLVTMRATLEQSLNLPTVRMMSELGRTPTEGLDYIRGITQELGLYEKPERYYPFVLGAQPTRLIDMATAYATIANDGLKPDVHFIESIEEGSRVVTNFSSQSHLKRIPSVDRVSFYQLRRILGGTVVRGTATKLKDLEGYIGAKTGTSNNENDAWFVGFTNDIVVAVWVGYDDRKVRSSLGSRFTGGRVALPIAGKILRDSFTIYKEKTPLYPPPNEIQNQLAEYNISLSTGGFGEGSYKEIFRRDSSGQNIIDSQRRLLKGSENQLSYGNPIGEEDNAYGAPQLAEQDMWRGRDPYYEPQYPGQYYQPGSESSYDRRRRKRRVDPYFQQPPFFQQFPFGGGYQ